MITILRLGVVMAAAFVVATDANAPALGQTTWIASPQPYVHEIASRQDTQDDEDRAWEKFGPQNKASRNTNRNDNDQAAPRQPMIYDRALRDLNDSDGGYRSRNREDERLRGRNYRD